MDSRIEQAIKKDPKSFFRALNRIVNKDDQFMSVSIEDFGRMWLAPKGDQERAAIETLKDFKPNEFLLTINRICHEHGLELNLELKE